MPTDGTRFPMHQYRLPLSGDRSRQEECEQYKEKHAPDAQMGYTFAAWQQRSLKKGTRNVRRQLATHYSTNLPTDPGNFHSGSKTCFGGFQYVKWRFDYVLFFTRPG